MDNTTIASLLTIGLVFWVGMTIFTALCHNRLSAGLFWFITLPIDFVLFLRGEPLL